MSSIEHVIEAVLEARARKRLGPTAAAAPFAVADEIQRSRLLLTEILTQMLDAYDVEKVPETVEPSPPEEIKEYPTQDILDRATKLQTLAMRSPSEHERNAAWAQFEKLWKRYHLPTNLGM